MHSDDHPPVLVRPMAPADRAAIADLIVSVENFNPAEIQCALELVDVYLNDKNQADYHVVVAEDLSGVNGYACYGPVPMTKGTYDLYWIATRRNSRGRGLGRALMEHIESKVLENGGRLLVIETSSKESYESTIEFYRRVGCEDAFRICDFYDVGDDKLVFVKRLS